MAKKLYNVVAKITREGQDKARWLTIGAAFESKNGGLAIKLDSLPVGPGWDGWLGLFEPRDDQRPAKPAAKPAADEPFNDSIDW